MSESMVGKTIWRRAGYCGPDDRVAASRYEVVKETAKTITVQLIDGRWRGTSRIVKKAEIGYRYFWSEAEIAARDLLYLESGIQSGQAALDDFEAFIERTRQERTEALARAIAARNAFAAANADLLAALAGSGADTGGDDEPARAA